MSRQAHDPGVRKRKRRADNPASAALAAERRRARKEARSHAIQERQSEMDHRALLNEEYAIRVRQRAALGEAEGTEG